MRTNLFWFFDSVNDHWKYGIAPIMKLKFQVNEIYINIYIIAEFRIHIQEQM